MSDVVLSEILGVLEALTAECKASARKVDAMDNLLHDKTPYGLGYDHALGRVADRAGFGEIDEALGALREILPRLRKDLPTPDR